MSEQFGEPERARFNLRIPIDLREKLEALSAKLGVPMNGLITMAVQRFIDEQPK